MANKRRRTDDHSEDGRDLRGPLQRSTTEPRLGHDLYRSGGDTYRPNERALAGPRIHSNTYESKRNGNGSPTGEVTLNTAPQYGNFSANFSPTEARSSTPRSIQRPPLPSPVSESRTPTVTSTKPPDPKPPSQPKGALDLIQSLLHLQSKVNMADFHEAQAQKILNLEQVEFDNSRSLHQQFPAIKEIKQKSLDDADRELKACQRSRQLHDTERSKILQEVATKLNVAMYATQLAEDVQTLKAQSEDRDRIISDMRKELGNFRASKMELTQQMESTTVALSLLQNQKDGETKQLENLRGFHEETTKKFQDYDLRLAQLTARADNLSARSDSVSALEDVRTFTDDLEKLKTDVENVVGKTTSIEETVWGSKSTSQGEASLGLIPWVERLENMAEDLKEKVDNHDTETKALGDKLDGFEMDIRSKANKLNVEPRLGDLEEKLNSLREEARSKDQALDAEFDSIRADIDLIQPQDQPVASEFNSAIPSAQDQERWKDFESRIKQLESDQPRNLSQQHQAPPTPPAQTTPTTQPANHIVDGRNLLSEMENLRETIRFLEDRYNNLTTEQMVNAIVYQIQNLFPLGKLTKDVEDLRKYVLQQVNPRLSTTMEQVTKLEQSQNQSIESRAIAERALNTSLQSLNTECQKTETSLNQLSEKVDLLDTFRANINSGLGGYPMPDMQLLNKKIIEFGDKVKASENRLDTCETNNKEFAATMNKDSTATMEEFEKFKEELSELKAKALYHEGTGDHKTKQLLSLEATVSKFRDSYNTEIDSIKARLTAFADKHEDLIRQVDLVQQDKDAESQSGGYAKLRSQLQDVVSSVHELRENMNDADQDLRILKDDKTDALASLDTMRKSIQDQHTLLTKHDKIITTQSESLKVLSERQNRKEHSKTKPNVGEARDLTSSVQSNPSKHPTVHRNGGSENNKSPSAPKAKENSLFGRVTPRDGRKIKTENYTSTSSGKSGKSLSGSSSIIDDSLDSNNRTFSLSPEL